MFHANYQRSSRFWHLAFGLWALNGDLRLLIVMVLVVRVPAVVVILRVLRLLTRTATSSEERRLGITTAVLWVVT